MGTAKITTANSKFKIAFPMDSYWTSKSSITQHINVQIPKINLNIIEPCTNIYDANSALTIKFKLTENIESTL